MTCCGIRLHTCLFDFVLGHQPSCVAPQLSSGCLLTFLLATARQATEHDSHRRDTGILTCPFRVRTYPFDIYVCRLSMTYISLTLYSRRICIFPSAQNLLNLTHGMVCKNALFPPTISADPDDIRVACAICTERLLHKRRPCIRLAHFGPFYCTESKDP